MADIQKLTDILMDTLPEHHPWEGEVRKLRDALIANGVTVRERGRWEWYTDRCEDLFLGCDEDYGWRCNRCKTPLEDCDDPEVHPTCNFCPNCGADMRGEEDGGGA